MRKILPDLDLGKIKTVGGGEVLETLAGTEVNLTFFVAVFDDFDGSLAFFLRARSEAQTMFVEGE